MTEVAKREKGGLELLGDLEREGMISTTGLHLTKRMSLPKFIALCALLGRMHQAVRFAIGDAIVVGEEMYGEKAFQAFEALEMSEEGMLEYSRVSRRVPRSTRRKDLSWSHHRAVAALSPPQQKEWLKRASDQQMSHHALRTALRAVNGDSERASDEVCSCCKRPL